MDAKDWKAFRGLFADDARFQYRPPDGPWEGLEACDRIEKLLVGATTVHHVHAPEIELLSEVEAKGVWAMEDWVFHSPARSELQSFHGQGHYHETYARVGGVWKISRLQLTRLHMEYVEAS